MKQFPDSAKDVLPWITAYLSMRVLYAGSVRCTPQEQRSSALMKNYLLRNWGPVYYPATRQCVETMLEWGATTAPLMRLFRSEISKHLFYLEFTN